MGAMQERIVLEEQTLGIPGLALLGRYHTHQVQKPMALHVHPGCAEFVVVLKGSERYASAGEEVMVSGGEVCFVPPDRPHGNASAGQGISDFIWFQLRIAPTDGNAPSGDVQVQTGLQPPADLQPPESAEGFLGLSRDAADPLLMRLRALRRPKWRTDDACLSRLAECVRFATGADPAWRGYARALFVACLEKLLHQAEAADRAETASRAEARERADAMARVVERMERVESEPPSLEALAAMAGLSLSRFKQVFRKTVGRTPREYANECRIQQAKQLLAKGLGVTETAMSLGFSGSDYFAVVFRRYTAMTPTEYAATCRPNAAGAVEGGSAVGRREKKASSRSPEGCR